MLPDSQTHMIIARQCSFSMCRIRLVFASSRQTSKQKVCENRSKPNMGVGREGKTPWVLKFYIFLLHF